MRFLNIAAVILGISLHPFVAWAESAAGAGGKNDAVRWSGKVELSSPLEIPANATLEIAPGTEVSASGDGRLIVRGSIKAVGTAEAPIRFNVKSGVGQWGGVLIEGATGPAELEFVEIRNGGVELRESNASFKDSRFIAADKGISVSSASHLASERIAVSDASSVGIVVFVGGKAVIADSRIERCAGAGLEIGQRGLVKITGTVFDSCKIGAHVSGDSSIVEKNTFTRNETGLLTIQAGRNTAIRQNAFTDNSTAISCRQFSTPLISENTIRDSKEGIYCFQGSSPRIFRNLIERCEMGVSAVQLCQPSIEKNLFNANKSAIYLTLSSYATIKSNNFEKNVLSVELDNMSADWEIRTSAKTPRGLAARNLSMSGKGKAAQEEYDDPTFTRDYVPATGNWWGADTTREMDAKGELAQIGAIRDYFDVPYRKYEGYEGEYVQDKVRYSKWLKEPVADAGPQTR